MEERILSTRIVVDPDDIEPAIREVLERTLRKRARGPYSARNEQQVREGLERLFAAEGYRGITITELRRLAGGASKEMFYFSLHHDGIEEAERLVLRMDPLESIIETSRRREAEIVRAMRGTVPVPEVRYLDHEGEFLGQSGVITSFVPGVHRGTICRSSRRRRHAARRALSGRAGEGGSRDHADGRRMEGSGKADGSGRQAGTRSS